MDIKGTNAQSKGDEFYACKCVHRWLVLMRSVAMGTKSLIDIFTDPPSRDKTYFFKVWMPSSNTPRTCFYVPQSELKPDKVDVLDAYMAMLTILVSSIEHSIAAEESLYCLSGLCIH